MNLEERIQRLEDDRAIRDLKARYLRACDLKRPDEVRETLLPKGAVIEFEGFPRFDDRDAFVAVFTDMACRSGIFDMHHAVNGIVRFDSDARAHGTWSLFFHNINLEKRTLTQMGVEYDDVYVNEKDRWWIAETRSRRTSTLIHSVDDAGKLQAAIMGEMCGEFGE